MFPQSWQVGLDIQSDSVRALAAQRRRNGWQLRHWWQHRLPQPVLRDGCLEPSESLIHALRQWRIQLPRHISLRIALPAQRVLQHRMPPPDARLREPDRNDYISSQGLKQFPLDGQTLALDYRADATTLLLTAARRQELQQWLHCLRQADLRPQAVDITPCALRVMATAAGLPAAAGLLHRLEHEWLWVAPGVAFACGVQPAGDPEGLMLALRSLQAAAAPGADRQLWYSSVLDDAPPADCLPWSPLSAFRQLRPPLPVQPAAFVLAGGLALREEDR
ncbi:type IV pilus assembly protein PilM [Serratia entomophila]|uniref:type IV pilus biogenesis protein PilM n=1 Tax=Serratia entomophila TaxID=42906 RepID=UPI0021777B07|nr:pilus assembly protein PilM [Serratia entomophila]CAI1102983.1 type IV pilus assembly protein PilM [Serratia entomophila]CAI1824567.1 type IV pilus assembly protein PilM [Serratia entomophila]CAI1862021.1 type IV pilus assembly protein PilM [Serratia entomophila]CAI1863768.1 type IV pilus assembly protein PilM [Serratia entomophila]CAI1905029.1 type IV pilus assembly protein PilM [Serratia entomophila]